MDVKARIFRPAKTATQSGRANTRRWVLEFEPGARREVDSLMGWSGSSDTRAQLRLSFAREQDAVAYAKRQGLSFEVIAPASRAVRPKSYADNFIRKN